MLYDNSFRQLIINVVATVFDRNGASALAPGDQRDAFAAVAAKGKQKGVQLLIICIDLLNDIFFSFFCFSQVHINYHRIVQQLVFANCQPQNIVSLR